MEEYTPKHSDPKPANNKSKKIAYYIMMAIAAALLLASIITFCISFFGKKEDMGGYKNSTTSTVSTALPANPIDFDAIQADYPDVCAWIQIPGIEQIDYPIYQSAAEADDNFYLDHNKDGKSDRYGEIYIQKLNSKLFDDPNTLIYGHNMNNGSMFGKLYDGSGKQFCNKEFFDEHRTIFVYTPGHILEYEVISAFVYDDRHILNSFNFEVENERQEFFDECVNPTSFTKQVLEGATLDTDDKIITLSTCTSNDSERYLVIGRLVSDTQTYK